MTLTERQFALAKEIRRTEEERCRCLELARQTDGQARAECHAKASILARRIVALHCGQGRHDVLATDFFLP